jgi:hypothetical protein
MNPERHIWFILHEGNPPTVVFEVRQDGRIASMGIELAYEPEKRRIHVTTYNLFVKHRRCGTRRYPRGFDIEVALASPAEAMVWPMLERAVRPRQRRQ